jgi:excisionase family DNA binding protein
MPKRPPTTVAKLAARWECKNHTVLALIHTGQLRAFKLRPGAKRPTWRIREEDVEAYERGDADEFERGELKKPKPKPRRQRRKHKDPSFVEYY